MNIRAASLDDLYSIANVEACCFPAAEAAGKEEFEQRLKYYANHFWLMYDEDKLIAFVDGFVTDLPDLTEEMYSSAHMHDENGAWQMIFGVNTVKEYRNNGFASQLINKVIEDAKAQGRKGVVLTCKEEQISWYEKFAFKNEGESKSVHGNSKWYQMRLTF
ncbi:MAG: GNAT family N-acetyltransferase [Clostridia bacterium]|nr:GNAT family N-acetyltransferase [Clostridia bacterium]